MLKSKPALAVILGIIASLNVVSSVQANEHKKITITDSEYNSFKHSDTNNDAKLDLLEYKGFIAMQADKGSKPYIDLRDKSSHLAYFSAQDVNSDGFLTLRELLNKPSIK